jgi:glycosyltransferase involved in cell wall biosynthesis
VGHGRPRILIVQPSLQPPGGGNGVCAWAVQALRDAYALTLLTWVPVDVDAINAYYGTSLRSTDFTTVAVSPLLRAPIDRLPLNVARFKGSVLRRRAKQIAGEFALLMSADNEVDFGRPGVQYVHYPFRHAAPAPVDLRWYHRPWTLALYERIWSLVAPFDDRAMRSNLTLVNSAWTGELVSTVHGIPVRVVHPPAAGVFPDVPWDERDDGFLCIGRVSPEKELERVIAIVERVRAERPEVHLHIVGTDDHLAYARRVRRLVRQSGPWVTVEDTLPIGQLARLLTTHRYVIHGMREEHFGMSIAQALRAGCIPFVPDGGGQVEVVGDEPLLRYQSADDAVAKILTVMASARLQQELRARLADRAAGFSHERFMDDIRAVVATALIGR